MLLIGAAAAAAPAQAEVARPPGANPDNRGYELVSLPDASGFKMGVGDYFDDHYQVLDRPPAVASTGGAAIVASFFALPGQPDRGGESVFRSVRQDSGAWIQTDVTRARESGEREGYPAAWSADLGAVLWSTDAPEGSKVLSQDGGTLTFSRNDAADPDNDPPQVNLYQRRGDGSLRQLNVAPDGSTIPNARLEDVSPDGSRAVFSADDGSGTGERLYLREGANTVQVDAARQALAGPRTDSSYRQSSTDLGAVFFVTRDRLVAADTDDDADIYRWSASGNDLQLVSRDGTSGNGSGQGPACPKPLPVTQIEHDVVPSQGCDVLLARVSPDGDVAYFFSPERFGGAPKAVPGGLNLYERRATGPIRHVMTLDPAADPGLPLRRDAITAERERFVTEPDGALVFAVSTNPASSTPFSAKQVLRVDPDSAAVRCVSCLADASGADSSSLSGPPLGESPTRNSADGGKKIFFESDARLVAADRNSVQDVYEYDVASGERTLISSGEGVTDNYFAGVSGDGADVMFLTTDTLVGRDDNGPVLKVYDARRGGGEETPASASAPCGDSCEPTGPGIPPFVLGDSGARGTSTGNVAAQPATRLIVGAVSATQRRTFARTGKLMLTVRTSRAATVRATARARLGRSSRTVATGSTRLARAGRARVLLRLSHAARRQLEKAGALKVALTTSVSGGSSPKRATLLLRATTTTKAGAR